MLAANYSSDTADASSGKNEDAGSSRNLTHSVKNKETVASIAKQYGLSAKTLMAMNQLKTSHLKQGQKLNITMAKMSITPSSKASATKLANANSSYKTAKFTEKKSTSARKNGHYIVKRGDTLESIARKFDIERNELRRWNNLVGSRIAPGNKLIVQRPSEA